jgi:protein JSN1
MVDRLWEIAQGRFGARSMRACLESTQITVNQQRRVATAIILNSIPLATNPNGALLLTWLLDTSGFPSRYKLLAPRFGPHLSHLCTHKLASLTVLRIVNQKVEPEASLAVVESLFSSLGDSVLTDVLGDQVNGVAVVHKILTSPFLDPAQRPRYLEATKRVIIELKVIATQAYRRLIEEVGLPIPQFSATFPTNGQQAQPAPKQQIAKQTSQGLPGLPSGYPNTDQGLASMMAALQMGGQNPHSGPPQLQIDPSFRQTHTPPRSRGPPHASATFSPASDPFNPFGGQSPPPMTSPRAPAVHRQNSGGPVAPPGMHHSLSYGSPSPSLGQMGGMMNIDPQQGYMSPQQPQAMSPPQMYQPYMYQQMYQQNPPMGQYQQ